MARHKRSETDYMLSEWMSSRILQIELPKKHHREVVQTFETAHFTESEDSDETRSP